MDYSPLIEQWQGGDLDAWARLLPEQLAAGLSPRRYGDLERWLNALASLPDIEPGRINLDAARVGAGVPATGMPATGVPATGVPATGLPATVLPEATMQALHDGLMGLHPWRKGPFELFGLHIDTEWRSDWKWDRLLPGLAPLAGRRVLDVGCGSGYHCWRMRGAGASEVIGIDPTPLFVTQFWALQKYLQQPDVWVLPAGIEQVPPKLQAFDTVFSMGVLYHRRSPMDHLMELRDCLRPGGQLVLETLVIEGGPGDTLVPQGRYARMGNVWFLPSCDTLLGWLGKLGLQDAKVVDVGFTEQAEQRATDWMRFHSLANFLDPNDHRKTIEGYPAPRRAVITANAAGTWQPRAETVA